MEEFVTIKVLKSDRDDLKLVAALAKEKMQDVITRLIKDEKEKQLAKQAASGKS